MPAAPPDLPGASTNDSPIDRGLALLLAGELEAALRWSAAAVQQEMAPASALILTSRLLSMMNRTEAAIAGFELGVKRAVDAGSLPLAVAAVGDLRQLGVSTERHVDFIAGNFCRDSQRLTEADMPPPPLPSAETFQPLSQYLSGPALLSRATEIIHEAQNEFDWSAKGEISLIAPVPLFSALDKESLRDLISCFSMTTVPAGHEVVREGEAGEEAYIVARGELQVQRRPREELDADGEPAKPLRLARLVNGALFGEMALLSRAPRAASVVASRPSILLVATRGDIEAVAAQRPEVATELAAHCRRRMVANLVRTSPVLRSVRGADRKELVERFETRVYGKGDKLIAEGAAPEGLHLVASGEVAVVGHDNGEPVLISTLVPGDTAGEVALVLRRKANADVVATHPTVTLFLPREDFVNLVRDFPPILHGLYMLAVKRDDETSMVLDDDTPPEEVDEFVLV